MSKYKITKKHIDAICKTCITGSCCRDGVEVDLEEAKKISKLKLRLKKPWFNLLQPDRDMPSGWSLSTVVRDGSCVFHKKDYKCRIYEMRPFYCRAFPVEEGEVSKFFHYLCEKPKSLKRKIKKHFKKH